MVQFTAECDGLLIVATVGNYMTADSQKTLTDLIVYINEMNLNYQKKKFYHRNRWQIRS